MACGCLVVSVLVQLHLSVLRNGPLPAAVAHGDVAVVAPQDHLSALGDHIAVAVDPGVHRGLGAAVADGLDLLDGVRQLKQPAAAGEELGLEVGAQAEAVSEDKPDVSYPRLYNNNIDSQKYIHIYNILDAHHPLDMS